MRRLRKTWWNGDIRAHVAAWEALDMAFGGMTQLPEFRHLTRPDDYAKWVQFKLGVIAAFYKRYCTTSIIGGPVDAFAITPRVGA